MRLRSIAKAGLLAALGAPLFAQTLPEGPGNKATARVCGQCHGLEVFASVRKSPEEWDKTITQMTEKGLQITDEDYQTVLEYLSKYLAKAPAKVKIWSGK